MKLQKKLLLAGILVLVLIGAGLCYHNYRVEHSYYAMVGEVLVVDKQMSGSQHYIVIKETVGLLQQEDYYYTLSCTKEQYDQVKIGDTINCYRDQSAITHKGEVSSGADAITVINE